MISRAEEPELSERVRDTGYTPKARDLPKLLDLMATEDEDLARASERAILRIEKQYLGRVIESVMHIANASERPLRGRLAKLIGRLSASGAPEETATARAWLVSAVNDSDPKTRRAAMRALGKVSTASSAEREAIERTLLSAWDTVDSDSDRRALAEALGKIGSHEARARLATVTSSEQPLGKSARVATLMIDRVRDRETPGKIDVSRAIGVGTAVRFHARDGLEVIVAEELGSAWRPRIDARVRGIVEAQLDGPLARATAIRTALHVGFPLVPARRAAHENDLAETIVRVLTSEESMTILRTFTVTGGGKIRFRLAWAHGGHRRALAWRCAELVAKASKELVNDPTSSTWEVTVDDREDVVAIELVPRGFNDDRFAYRVGDVAASSHPTIAAALARLTPRGPNDIVWDPFVGAGTELVERAILGPYRMLLGSDISMRAVEIARANLANASVNMSSICRANALLLDERDVNVIVTNPPMGRRLERGAHGELLARFVFHAARTLVPGGVMVWAVPEPQRLRVHARRAGFSIERELVVDMGGFPATLSVARKRAPICV
ncbi:MAG: HEAT repeat domain-containing protein [Polyangiaceae bacterium]|nr:HEAT repeat domain-containing protein [Polyangiaceae bacterium]